MGSSKNWTVVDWSCSLGMLPRRRRLRAEQQNLWNRWTMPRKRRRFYVCIEVALHGIAHGIGWSNWAEGKDPSGSWVEYPNPAVPLIPLHARWIILTHSTSTFWTNFNLGSQGCPVSSCKRYSVQWHTGPTEGDVFYVLVEELRACLPG